MSTASRVLQHNLTRPMHEKLRFAQLGASTRQNQSMICLKMQSLMSLAKSLKIDIIARMLVFTMLWRRNVCGSEPIIAKLTSAYARLAHLARQKQMFLHMSRLAYLFEENGPILRTLKMQFGAMPTDKWRICIGIICKFLR